MHSRSDNTVPVYGSDSDKSNTASTKIINNKTNKDPPQQCRPEESMKEYLGKLVHKMHPQEKEQLREDIASLEKLATEEDKKIKKP